MMLLTSCPEGVFGAHCDNVTSSPSSQSSYVPVSHAWIAGLVAALVIVALTTVPLIYCLRKNG